MAKGSVRKKGKKWYYRFYVEDASGNLVQKECVGTESKSETEKLLRQAMDDYEKKKFVAKAENLTVGQLLDVWAEESLYTHINCMEMERVRKIDCCFDEFKLCRILMRSKKRLPDMIYTRIGPAIIKVSNIMDDIIFTSISLRKYANNKERKYGNIDQYYYYVNDGYIYIPDINIEAINVDLITLDRKAALELGGCGAEKDKPCTSQWDYDFICPDKLLEYVVSETLRETITKLQIPTDENPDMDINKKTQKIQ